jgi:hypothetical protein
MPTAGPGQNPDGRRVPGRIGHDEGELVASNRGLSLEDRLGRADAPDRFTRLTAQPGRDRPDPDAAVGTDRGQRGPADRDRAERPRAGRGNPPARRVGKQRQRPVGLIPDDDHDPAIG